DRILFEAVSETYRKILLLLLINNVNMMKYLLRHTLIVDNILYKKSMTWKQAMRTYNVSRASISCIRQKELQLKSSGPKLSRKRGRVSPLTLTLIHMLHYFEEDPGATLDEIVADVESHFPGVQTQEVLDLYSIQTDQKLFWN